MYKKLFSKAGRLLTSQRAWIRGLSLLDQIMFSAANFILALTLAKYYSNIEVAGFGIGLSVALVIQGLQRTCYVVQNAVLSPLVFRRRAASVMGEHFIVWGIILLLEVLVAGVLWCWSPGEYYVAIMVSSVVCSLIYAQLDFERIVLIKHDKVVDPFIASVAFVLIAGGLFFAIPRFDIGFLTTMLIVGLYAAAKIARLVLLVDRPDFFWGWRLAKRDYRKYLRASLLSTASYSGYGHAPLFVLGAFAVHVPAAAAFVAMRGLIQPLNVVLRSLDVIDKNLFQVGTVRSPRDLRPVLLRQLVVYGGMAGLAVLAIAVAGPFVIHHAYGHKYDGFEYALLGWGLISVPIAVTFPLETAIVKLGRLYQYNLSRSIAGIAGLGLSLLLCPPFGALGALIACLSGWIISVACGAWVIRDVFVSQQPAA